MRLNLKPNAQINIARPDSLAVRAAASARQRMFEVFLASTDPQAADTLLDVGVTSDRSYAASNYLEAWYPNKAAITAVGLDDARFLCEQYPGVRFVFGDGLNLPFGDRSFDVVHSSAVIEHVGDRFRQRAFIAELCRVARRAVFLTTPNRYHPIEFHTLLPLAHWLPVRWFHAVLRATGRSAFADERVLNLLDRNALLRLSNVAGWSARVDSIRFLGFESNLLLTLTRRR